ncbi:MAG: 2-oxo acid dehydrogenase subunit E2 [bacterium]|nr:2-oxo acid dehydrogenase subunit E2 [bacterium]
MATRVFMPKSGMDMEEGTIVQWLKKEGETVEAGEPLLEIETDKVTMEVEAPAGGVLLEICRREGETVPVTQTIAWIGEAGEIVADDGAADNGKTAAADNLRPAVAKAPTPVSPNLQPAGDKVAATPLARRLALEKGVDLKSVTPTGSSGEVKARDIAAAKTIKATPLARKMAQDLNIDLAAMDGTGFGAKIKESDILAASSAAVEGSRQPMSAMRRTIAKRMLQSHLCAPPVTQLAKADVTELLEVRKKLNAVLDVKISLNDILLKVTALALKAYPALNASLDGDHIIHHPFVNLGMAVALEDGLIVPVIRNADRLTLPEISTIAGDLADKARNGKLRPDDFTGGTFTVSNMGQYGIYSFTPIINQPESAILGVCSIEDQLTLNGTDVIVRKMMGLSLTFDHRVIDGAQCAIFQNRIKSILENPYSLLAYKS